MLHEYNFEGIFDAFVSISKDFYKFRSNNASLEHNLHLNSSNASYCVAIHLNYFFILPSFINLEAMPNVINQIQTYNIHFPISKSYEVF